MSVDAVRADFSGKEADQQQPIVEGGRWRPRTYAQLPLHRNHGLEVVIIRHGQAQWQVDGVSYALGPGDLFFTFPWQVHGSAEPVDPAIELDWAVFPLTHETPHKRLSFAPGCQIQPAMSQQILARLSAAGSHALQPTIALRQLFSLLIKEHLAEQPGRSAQLGILLQAVMGELLRSILCRTNDRPQVAAERVSASVVQAWSRICRQHDRSWSLAAMAAEAKLGTTRFSRLMKAYTGDSPLIALTRERLRAACADLLESDASVTTIAHAHGFGSSQAFAKVFRRYCLQSPSEFRASGGRFAPRFADG